MSYLVHSDEDRKKMMEAIGINKTGDLFKSIPEKLLDPVLDIDRPKSEKSIKEELVSIGSKNNPLYKFSSFIGGGAYNHYIPAAVKEILSISQFYTAYTPYQAEISQGTLQYIFEFQTLMCRLTGMDISNASMYDGASSLAEAILMAKRINNRNRVLVPETLNPQYLLTCQTYCNGSGIEIDIAKASEGKTDMSEIERKLDDSISAVVIQNPNFLGFIEDVFQVRKLLDSYPDCIFIIVMNPITVGLMKSPSEYGADIVVGDAQVFGNPLSFGGPYIGFFSTKQDYLRQMPGRIVGKTKDIDNKDAYVLTFQTREQHIRKSKATSNICTNHSLNALAATVYLCLLGEKGLSEVAEICVRRAHYLCDKIKTLEKFKVRYGSSFFNEFVLSTHLDIKTVFEAFYSEKILPGLYLGDHYKEMDDCLLVSVTEMNSLADLDRYLGVLKGL